MNRIGLLALLALFTLWGFASAQEGWVAIDCDLPLDATYSQRCIVATDEIGGIEAARDQLTHTLAAGGAKATESWRFTQIEETGEWIWWSQWVNYGSIFDVALHQTPEGYLSTWTYMH